MEGVLSRNTVEEVYTSILSDLTTAETYLNVAEWDKGYNYRFNIISADALRSRVNLYMENWKEAFEASERVLEERNEIADISAKLPNEYDSPEMIVGSGASDDRTIYPCT